MYGFTTSFDGDFYFALERLSEELSKEGFEIYGDLDLQQSLNKKSESKMSAYRLLSVYHAYYAEQVIAFDPTTGTLLPNQIVVWENRDNDVMIAFADPRQSLGLALHPSMLIIAESLRKKLQRVCDNLVD
ncbi:DUF302 domain-containing protein [Vibrio sp. SM6]|uniref:DUF302 domain-containing protein n=1 Tax=Vibrio agarilyticus TaxID=2726741 RepID=A0A7X8TSB8_9VIBR|nr:DUF302 domain-containing protein [Vibrio agarilyticus]NLS13904.1 DUF302 domain-containing protein [Vibrio agarilyticus]